ncbi:hypothetical protein A3Q56_05711 [Intoshia linei]|uniref:PAS domain-containing protein n=1 Tax=Intoshia linei TaxID=1819745 RepID=A0A177AYR8_9BILA|nr:hypothetical protein A3Q56_05711 [Intoshia linei]
MKVNNLMETKPVMPGLINGLIDAIDGFLLVIDKSGIIFLAGECIERVMGYHQVDILHQNIYSIIHSEDREILQSCFNQPLDKDFSQKNVKLCFRLRSVKSVNNTFTPINMTGVLKKLKNDYFKQMSSFDIYPKDKNQRHINWQKNFENGTLNMYQNAFTPCIFENSNTNYINTQQNVMSVDTIVLFAICKPISNSEIFNNFQLISETKFENTFQSVHSLDFKFIQPFYKISISPLININLNKYKHNYLYDLITNEDLNYALITHQKIVSKGHGILMCYRWKIDKCNKNPVWIQTYAKIDNFKNKNNKINQFYNTPLIFCYHRILNDIDAAEFLKKRTSQCESKELSENILCKIFDEEMNIKCKNNQNNLNVNQFNQLVNSNLSNLPNLPNFYAYDETVKNQTNSGEMKPFINILKNPQNNTIMPKPFKQNYNNCNYTPQLTYYESCMYKNTSNPSMHQQIKRNKTLHNQSTYTWFKNK